MPSNSLFSPFNARMVHAVDGDSVWVNREMVGQVKVRVGGIDVPSSGTNAEMAKSFIEREWPRDTPVHVKPTSTYLVHGEIPAVVTLLDNPSRNLGKELLQFGERLAQFPIEKGHAPPLTHLKV